MKNEQISFGVCVGNQLAQKITIEVFRDVSELVAVLKNSIGGVSRISPNEYFMCGADGAGGGTKLAPMPNVVRRKHAFAGIVSVFENNQLSVTLGKVNYLKGHLIVGQICQGMNVLKDLENIPTDVNGKPKVYVEVVPWQADEPTRDVEDVAAPSTAPDDVAELVSTTEDVVGPTTTDLSNPMERRLFELKLKMNKAKQLNNQAVLTEKKRIAGHHEKTEDHADDVSGNSKSYLLKPASVSSREARKETFAWDRFNEDSLYKAHDKRVDQMGFYPDAYERQKIAVGDNAFYAESTNVGHTPTEDAKIRLAESIKLAGQKRKEFSRRRVQNDEADDVLWINDKNREFTKRIDRAFGKHTAQIKANLERGTAL